MHCSGISGVRPDSQRTIIRVITLCALDDWVYVDSLEEALFYLLNIRRVKSKDADSSLAAGAFAVEVVCPMAISNIDKQGLVSRHVAPRLPNYTTPRICYKCI
jgi:hypothetical protein